MTKKSDNSSALRRVEHLMAIQEHWFWCDSLRNQAMKMREDIPGIIMGGGGNPLAFLYSDFLTFCFMWLGLLFVVCEALKTNHFVLPSSLQNEISLHYEKLKDFRNSIFHVRPRFRSSEFLTLSKQPDFVQSMNRIHFGLRDWFKEEMERAVIQSGCDERVAAFVAALSRGERPK